MSGIGRALTIGAAIALSAMSAHAAMDCQAPADYVLANYDRPTFWTNCGYWYDEPLIYTPPIDFPEPPIVEPPFIDPHIPAVPEPAAWALMIAGLVVVSVARLLKGKA